MLNYETSDNVSIVDDIQRQEELIKEKRGTIRLRNVSISVLVFVLLWVACIGMAIAFCLTQVGFAEKYPTITLENGEIISSGFEFIKTHSGSAYGVKFQSDEQRIAFYFSRHLWLGLTGVAFLFCLVANILLIVLKRLNNTYDPDEGSFASGAMGILFKLTGVLMFGSTLAWIFGWFTDGGVKWLMVGIVIFILAFILILVISLILFTICGIVVSSLSVHDTNKELKLYKNI